MKAVQESSEKRSHLPVFAAVAFVFTLFLFFIDEGHYSFEGLADVGNIIALSFYFVAMLLGQAVLYAVLRSFLSESLALRIALFAGSLLGSIAMAVIFYFWMKSRGV